MTPSEVTAETIVVWAAAITTLISAATTLWHLLVSGSRKNAARIVELDQKLDDKAEEASHRADRQEARISRIEQTVQGLPAREDIHGVQLALSEMRGDLRTMSATMEGNQKIMVRLEAIVSRHEDHLISGTKK